MRAGRGCGCGCGCGCGRVGVGPFFHFFMAAGGDGACEGGSYELGCESQEFLVGVFPDVVNDLLGGE